MRGRSANKPVVIQNKWSEAEQRCGDEGKGEMKWNLRMLGLEDQIKRVHCVFACPQGWIVLVCLYVFLCVRIPWATTCLCVLMYACVYICVCVCVRVTQLWLALQLITRCSQLLITQHLFCPHSTLFCAYYQPGSGRRIRGRALCNTLTQVFLSAVSSSTLCCRGHLCMHLLETDPANSQTFESLLNLLIFLLSWRLFTQRDDIMAIKRGSVPFHFLSGGSLVCVLG